MHNGHSHGLSEGASAEADHFESFVYPNGLRLVTVPMTDRRVVTVLVLVGTGSRYETKPVNGISHFLEHMMFKGTAKRPGALDISQELDSIGADSNAFTSKEYTGYYARASYDKLDLILDIISDIFQNSKFEDQEIAKEKGVIVEEINMYLDTPRRYVNDIFEQLLYGDQPLGWDIAGEKDTVKSLTRDDIINYFNTHYFAENTIVAVSGKIDSQEIYSKISQYFGNVRHHEPIAALAVDDNHQSGPGLHVFNKTTDQSHINLGVRAYNNTDPRTYALELLAIILGGNMSSRLFTELREKRGLAYSTTTFVTNFTDAGYLATQLGVDNSRLMEALKVTLDEYKKIRDVGVPEVELQKAKDFNKGKTLMALDSPDFIASYTAEQLLLKKTILTPQEELELYDRVTVDDVQRVARDIFVPHKLNLAIIGPWTQDNQEIQDILSSF